VILEVTGVVIDSVAPLHKLSDRGRGTLVDLDQYLASVCNAAGPALSIRGRIQPEYKLSCDYSAAPEFALSIGLAVAELLTNAFRHAHPAAETGKVAVTAIRRGDTLIIEVSDDGVGLPIGYRPGSGEGIGLRLVQQTAARWEGKVEFHDCKPGLRVRLVLPLEPGPEQSGQ
jgi:two-component sensor histidine kinase